MTPKNILLIRLSSIGDVLHCTPVAKNLRHRFPNAKISWIVGEKSKDILVGNPFLDEVIIWEREKWEAGVREGAWYRGYEEFRQLERILRASEFDLAIDMHGLLLTGLIAWRSGASKRIGFANAKEGSPMFYTTKVASKPKFNVVRNYLELLRPLNINRMSSQMVMPLAEEDFNFAKDLWDHHVIPNNGYVVVLNPMTSWPTKCWPPEAFVELANLLQRGLNTTIVLLGSPSEVAVVNKIAAGIHGTVINLAAQTNLKELAAVIQKSDVFVGGDTGPLHIAAAVGTPTISLFGPTDPTVYAPEGEDHIALSSDVHCRFCHKRACHSFICMDRITPQQVYKAVRRQLLSNRNKPKNLEATNYGQVSVKKISTFI